MYISHEKAYVDAETGLIGYAQMIEKDQEVEDLELEDEEVGWGSFPTSPIDQMN